MPLIDKLEAKLGRFAIHGLVQIIAILQLLTLVLFLFISADARDAYFDFLTLRPDRVLHGEVWRLFTYIFIPRSTSIIFAVIGAMFLMWLGRGLEQAWGAFRVNLYVLGGMLALAIGALIFGYDANAMWLLQTLLFAFACIYPNEEILLFLILPVKIKWIAWLGAATSVLIVLAYPSAGIPLLFSHLNFLIVFVPDFFRQRVRLAKVADHRSRFEAAQPAPGVSFHRCTVCRKTELDDPSLEFRVTDAGEEICSKCRAAGAVSKMDAGAV